jgi:hypothetical protein
MLIAAFKKEISGGDVLACTIATITVDSKLYRMPNSSTDAITVAISILSRIFDRRFW